MAKNWVMAPLENEPGHFDQVWKYDRENNVISIGWDVGGFDSPKELKSRYQERARVNENWTETGFRQLKAFWYDIKPGDRIIARRGRKKIVGIGTVVGSPFYSPKMKVEQAGTFEPDHAYFLPTEWKDFEREFPDIKFGMHTLYPVPDDRFEEFVNEIIIQPGRDSGPRTMGSRLKENGIEHVYAAAEVWADRALGKDDSLFTPGKRIWTPEYLKVLHEKFLNNPDVPGIDFYDKLKSQLAGSPPDVYQLMAEALYVHFLALSHESMRGNTKQKRVSEVIGWSEQDITLSSELVDGLASGIANFGGARARYLPYYVGFLIEFAERWKEQGSDRRQRMLADPWQFKDFAGHFDFRGILFDGRANSHRAQLEALLHLVFPDAFEAIVSVDDKNKIAGANALARYVTKSTDDVDRRIAQIRPPLEAKYGSRDHFFYQPEIEKQWRDGDSPPPPDPWDAFIDWAKRFYEWEPFDAAEREYKLEIGKDLASVKQGLLNGDLEWEGQLLKTLRSPDANNLVYWSTNDTFLKTDRMQKERSLRRIWGLDDSTSLEVQVRGFQELAPVGTPAELVSFLLMANDASRHPMYRYTPLKKAYQLVGYAASPNDSSDAWERYEHALGFFDKFIEEASSHGLRLRDRLDAQALTWCVTQYKREDLPEDWPEEAKERFIAYQRGESQPPPPPVDPWSAENIATLAENLLWEPMYLQRIIDDLQDKRQVIFYGPPGTGKTFVAREIAKQCQLNGGESEIIQFHPSYSYEDFVEGIRPKLMGDQTGFELVQGPLRRIADKAKDNKDVTYILVIDELNRGNVAKVFGELYFLLEYRDEPVRLQYGGGGEKFSLPSNLWFICTMNTADRSIALMDAALRRRFYFAAFFPNEPPIQGLLRRWLNKKGQDTLAADLIDQANKNLDRDAGIGPSYFMRPNQILNEESLRRIWERAVVPYVEEQCFGDDAKLQTFKFDALKRQIDGSELSQAGATSESITEQAIDAPPETN